MLLIAHAAPASWRGGPRRRKAVKQGGSGSPWEPPSRGPSTCPAACSGELPASLSFCLCCETTSLGVRLSPGQHLHKAHVQELWPLLCSAPARPPPSLPGTCPLQSRAPLPLAPHPLLPSSPCTLQLLSLASPLYLAASRGRWVGPLSGGGEGCQEGTIS